MKVFRSVILFVILIFSVCKLSSQELKENEIVVIKGEKYVLHQVKTGETIYSLSKKFKTDSLVLVQNNPILSGGLKIGEVLKIPYKTSADLSPTPVSKNGDPTRFDYHTIISRKETPYFIAKSFGITIEQLYAYNPEVRKFRKGTKLRIPRWDTKLVEETAEIEEDPKTTVSKNDTQNNLLIHTVLSGETVYSISKKYGISESEILFNNPNAKNLKTGTNLYLPLDAIKGNEVPEEPAEKKEIEYFEHIIESGETLWGTSRKYKVSEKEIVAVNPILETGFPAGAVIKIPVYESAKNEVKPVNENAFIRHKVQSGETLYGLAAKYNYSIPKIKEYNPVLENRNLLVDEIILIPNKPNEENVQFENESKVDSIVLSNKFYEFDYTVDIPESCMKDETGIFLNSSYNVALFLPLFIEANDTLNRTKIYLSLEDSLAQTIVEIDTLAKQDKTVELFSKFYGSSENFLQFYEGVLLAVDSMQNTGMKINLRVFDTEQNRESIRKYIYTEDFLETDLIIGPIFPNVQNEVAQIAAKNRIPIISPLVSQSAEINSNSSYYLINPTSDYLISRTSEMVVEEYFNSNFVIVKTRNYENTEEGTLVNQIREKLYNSGFLNEKNGATFSIYDFKNEGPFGLRRILSKRKENVVLIPSTDEGELSVAISNLDNLTDDYSITLIGSRFYQQRNKSIEVKHFHDLKMRYITPFWIDYKNYETIKFIEKFKENFAAEPGNYGSQGYDVALYFLSALKYFGKNFEDCLPYFHDNLIQGKYHFEKVTQFGGYMNQGVSVVSYQPNFEVVRSRVKGQPKLVAEK